MANNNTILVLAVIAILAVGGGYVTLNNPKDATNLNNTNNDQPASQANVSGVQCTSNTTATGSFSFVDAYSTGTARTDVNINVYVNGALRTSTPQNIAATATFATWAPGDKYLIYVTNNTATQNRFGKIISGTVPCATSFSVTDTPEKAAIYSVGTFSATLKNNDGSTANSIDASAQAMGSGEAVSMTLRVKENTASAYLSPANEDSDAPPPLVVCDANFASIFARCEVADRASATVPEGHSTDSNATGQKAQFLPELAGKKNFGYEDYSLIVEAKSGVNPGTQNFLLSFYMPQFTPLESCPRLLTTTAPFARGSVVGAIFASVFTLLESTCAPFLSTSIWYGTNFVGFPSSK